MISIDFFVCKEEQIVTCSWEDACERFFCTGLSIPDWGALTLLSEILTGSNACSAERILLSNEPFYILDKRLTTAIRNSTEEELLDAGARWAQFPLWSELHVNPMDLAGFLLNLHSSFGNPETEENSIYLWVESDGLPES